MANRLHQWSSKLSQCPGLSTPGQRITVGVVVIFGALVVLGIMQGNQLSATIAACKTQGGKPFYRTQVREVPTEGGSFSQSYQVFDHCDLGQP
jgi:hypothetical protein